jgi:hypothetical protein
MPARPAKAALLRTALLTDALLTSALALCAAGCGINKSRLATEQLVVSEAVDQAVASVDFSPLSGCRVYFDTQFVDGLNMGPNGNVKYVISSLRQQMMAYDLRLQEKAEAADFIVEARVGVLANDGYEVTYGIPGNAAAASATVLLPTPVPVPAPGMPELSIGRRNHQAGTAKVGLFAYDRTTREPVWQSGIKRGGSDVRDSWFLGLGPYHYRPTRNKNFWASKNAVQQAELAAEPLAAYSGPIVFERAVRPSSAQPTQTAVPTAPTAPQVVPASSQLPMVPPIGAGLAPVGSSTAQPRPPTPEFPARFMP